MVVSECGFTEEVTIQLVRPVGSISANLFSGVEACVLGGIENEAELRKRVELTGGAVGARRGNVLSRLRDDSFGVVWLDANLGLLI